VTEQIDRYELASEIGHGGMATVYRARDTRLDRWVAVKLMHPHLRGTVQARARFSREARAVAKLKHPSILEIYDYSGSESETAYIATELLTGPTLRAFVEQLGEVPPEIAACIGAVLASALAAAHAEGIVHRDVKPENVLLHSAQQLKLTDFGIADMVDPTMSTMTATGQILGSPAHMAPEQVEGGDTDARTDVFALGTILYWLATGTLPFTGKNPHQVLKRVVEAPPTDPLLLRPVMGRPLRDIVLRCLEKSPAQRYQSAAELERALIQWLSDLAIADPGQVLAAYLRDPQAEGERLRLHVQQRLLDQARAALARDDRVRAVECLDRVLAADEQQPDALALLAKLERTSRTRSFGRAAFAVAALGGCVALWGLFAPRPEELKPVFHGPLPTPAARAAQAVAPSASTPSGEGQATQPPGEPNGDPQATTRKSAKSSRPKPAVPSPPSSSEPRTVRFAPEPANVTISIDGAAPQSFGPAFRSVELSPGHHTFEFVGAHACCEDARVELDLPGGPGETTLAPKLVFRRARVYVASNVPADVRIEGEEVGRARSIVVVPPLHALSERRQISVTAPGYAPYTGMVELRAGEVTELAVTLEASAPRP
jgi:eukaryotic-like serine/threonine-protein kinase